MRCALFAPDSATPLHLLGFGCALPFVAFEGVLSGGGGGGGGWWTHAAILNETLFDLLPSILVAGSGVKKA